MLHAGSIPFVLNFLLIFPSGLCIQTSLLNTNSCAVFGRCSQLCKNVGVSYQCSCVEGFTATGEDKSRCLPQDPTWKLIYTTYSEEVYYISHGADGLEQRHLISGIGDKPGMYSHAVTYNARSNTAYWSDTSLSQGAIFQKSLGKNSKIKIVADSGVYFSTGIAFDWITGNIYFSDESSSQIVVCGNGSQHLCSVLIHGNIDKPGGIALHPNLGIMYFTEYGEHPRIIQAAMDGSNLQAIVSTNLRLPVRLALDFINSRLYFVDRYYNKIESVRLDGSDRRTIITLDDEGSTKVQPSGIDILGDRLFWTEYNQGAIMSADKFTGMERKTHFHQKNIGVLGMSLMHLANQPIHRTNPCLASGCSHLCTIASASPFKCMCPIGMSIDSDGKTCTDLLGHPKLVVAVTNTLYIMRLNSIGRDVFEPKAVPQVTMITAMVYNPANHTIILNDVGSKTIYEYDMAKHKMEIIVSKDLGVVKALDLDIVNENLYWIDEEKETLEVMSLRTRARKVMLSDISGPIDILVSLELRYDLNVQDATHVGNVEFIFYDTNRSLFLTTKENETGLVYKMQLDGVNKQRFFQVPEPVTLTYRRDTKELIWTELRSQRIGSISVDKKTFNAIATEGLGHPSGTVVFKNELYWIDISSKTIKTVAFGKRDPRTIKLAEFGDASPLPMIMTIVNFDQPGLDNLRESHECSPNGKWKGCTHLCLPNDMEHSGNCVCTGDSSLLGEDEKTCIGPDNCSDEQFQCSDGSCLEFNLVCNGAPNCVNGEDEANCNKTICPSGNSTCESFESQSRTEGDSLEGDNDSKSFWIFVWAAILVGLVFVSVFAIVKILSLFYRVEFEWQGLSTKVGWQC